MSSSPPPKPAGQEEDHAILLSCPSTTVARSSTSWKHDSHRFGPQHALDSGTDAAWKSAPSDGTEPNYYEVIFGRSVEVRDLRIMFQGGFVGVDCTVFTKTTDCQEEWEECEDLFIDAEDSNEMQVFEVDSTVMPCVSMRIEFGRSTDFYGRIVIYSLEVWGRAVEIAHS